ncbi:hypothetical protein KSD_55040 [Ktedonobacter sp. SOSP1-85]|nr:hypothetical protein KSD_55040 [Ktedonobacter sp. SOSP1-85]
MMLLVQYVAIKRIVWSEPLVWPIGFTPLIVTVNKMAQKKNLTSRKNLAIFYSISEGKGSI